MTDTAKRIIGPTHLSTASAVLYTVPSGTTTIIRSIHVATLAPSTLYTFNVGISAAATSAPASFLYAIGVPPNGCFDWSGMLVLSQNEYLSGLASANTQLTITVCGIEVTA